ncbi:MAG TPA: potassium-transporting ATPase subunit C [Candidatus Nitrosopolaris sp.]|nr:potassium-transporting ATPase subunit C [Candidatus Nitrosopolaris sp.]
MINKINRKGLKMLEKIKSQINKNTLSPAIKVVILMLVVTGIVYPLVLVVIGQSALPYQSNGSLITINDKVIGSKLIAQEFKSSKFFHPRPSSDSASNVDPDITPEKAISQIANVSHSTGINPNALRTLIDLNIEKNKVSNMVAFAPDYVNVLEVNLELVNQYPEVYSTFLNNAPPQNTTAGFTGLGGG